MDYELRFNQPHALDAENVQHETGPPAIVFTEEEDAILNRFYDAGMVMTIAEHIPHVLYRGNRKYTAAHDLIQNLEELTKMVENNGISRERATEILAIFAKYGITAKTLEPLL